MVIALTPMRNGELWSGSIWAIEDEDRLAELIARVAVGQARVAADTLRTTGTIPPGYPETAKYDGARRLLTVGPGGEDCHRDGWMFQVISWVASHRAGADHLIRSPHMIHAHKGLDGLIVELDEAEIARVVISEEKATNDARGMIHSQVWPEFASLETGQRDNELTDGVAALLARSGRPDADDVAAAILWDDQRAYRVAVTVSDTHASEDGRKRLYKGYEEHVAGDVSRRRAEAIHLTDLRDWFERMAQKVLAVIDAEEGRSNV